MNEEKFFTLTDELMMEAQEDHALFVRRLERTGFCHADIIEELRVAIDSSDVDWSRIFILAILGVSLND